MTGSHSATQKRGWKRLLGGVLAVLLIAAGALSWQFGYAEKWWDRWVAQESTYDGPADIAPPPEIALPPVRSPAPVARPARGEASLDPAAIERALGSYFTDRDLGPHLLAAVAPLRGAGGGFERARGNELGVPASITKVVTSSVALAVLGGDHRFTTRTVLDTSSGGAQLVLVGGGDPYLAREPYERGTSATFDLERRSMVELARRTARKLKRRGLTRVTLGYDATLFTGPTGHPTWREDPELEVGDYIEDEVIAPISALWVDQGHKEDSWGRVPDPARAAAQVFGDELRRAGITVVLGGSTLAPAGARQLAAVQSAPLSHIVQRLLEVSDNAAAEVLLRHIGRTVEGEGSFAAGEAGVRRTLAAHGIEMGDSVLYDGSGLSRASRVTPGLLVEVLRWVADPAQLELRPVLTSLPVAGFTGSLVERFEEADPQGLGRVRAKTGTLTGVSSLAGIAVDRDGNLMAFVLMADRIDEDDEDDAREAQDAAAARLAACRCGTP